MTGEALQLRPGVEFFPVGDEGVVFSDAAQALYAFDRVLTFVWRRIESGEALPRVRRTLAEGLDVPEAEAVRRLREILDRWRSLGLLAGGEPPRYAPPGHFSVPLLFEQLAPEHAAPTAARERHYRLLDTRIVLRCAEPEQEAWLHPVFAHLETPDRDGPQVTFDVLRAGDRHFVYEDGRSVSPGATLERFAPFVKTAVMAAALRRHRFLLTLHAGTVQGAAGVLLLPAAPGSGKSLLTLALCRSGYRFFSDEVAPLEDPGHGVRPVPLSLCFKHDGWSIAAGLDPEIQTLRTHHRSDGKLVRYLPPAAVAPDASVLVTHLVFPCWEAGARTALEPIGTMDALRRLLGECVAVEQKLTRENVARLVDWAKGLRCYRLRHASLDDAVAAIRSEVPPAWA